VSNFPESCPPEKIIEHLKEGKDESYKVEDESSLYTF
jgi:hypothetical protein